MRVIECLKKGKDDEWLAKWIRHDKELRKARLSLSNEELLNACIENVSLQHIQIESIDFKLTLDHLIAIS